MDKGWPPPGGGVDNGPAPKYLLLIRDDKLNFDSVSPFQIFKSMSQLVGNVISCKKVKDGLLIDTASTNQAIKLLNLKCFMDLPVTVQPHKSRNTSKGVIYHRELVFASIEEIKEAFLKDGVVDVKKMKKRQQDGSFSDTGLVILTFNRPILPRSVTMGWEKLDVRVYIPEPTRCYHCQHYRHSAIRCPARDQPRTCICGKPNHEGTSCILPVTCLNCEGPHLANSRNCPVFQQEARIEQVRITENLSYAEARKRVSTPPTSYSSAASKSTSAPQSTAHMFDPAHLVDSLKPVLKQLIKEVVAELMVPSVGTNLLNLSQAVRGSNDSIASIGKRKTEDTSPPCSTDESTIPGTKDDKRKKKKSSPKRSVPPLKIRLSQQSNPLLDPPNRYLPRSFEDNNISDVDIGGMVVEPSNSEHG